MLNVGWAWFLGLCFSSPLWAILVVWWGMPQDLIDLLKYSGVVGTLASIIAIGLILIMKFQARKP